MTALAPRVPALLLALAAACSPVPAVEDEPWEDEKQDSLRSPRSMGALAPFRWRTAEIDGASEVHAWTFSMGSPAEVTVETGAPRGGGALDTVAYLYQLGDDGRWGRYLEKNDDGGAAPFSRIARRLDAGVYRVVVKGKTGEDQGAYRVRASGFPPDCVFGASFADIEFAAASESSRQVLTAEKRDRIRPEEVPQIIRALHASSHDDVTTLDEAFAAVDGGEINRVILVDTPGSRSFVAFEYGAGDNSFGAIFPRDSAEPAALIIDGDIDECQVGVGACVFGSTIFDLDDSDFIEARSEKTLTAESSLTPDQERQVLLATRATDLREAFEENVEEGEITLTEYRDRATGEIYRAYQFHAGGNPVGMMFDGAGTEPIAEVSDGDIESCTRFF
jgi:hypothetical protein